MSISFEDYCKKNGKEDLLHEWDFDKNAPLKPSDFGFASNKKVFWKCDKNHSWEATIANRSRWSNCPYCAGKKVSEDNCLAFNFPDVAKEWDYIRNGNISPRDVTSGTQKKYWWICSRGHSYETSVYLRTISHTKCPYCANQKLLKGFNDLATTNPSLAKEWDYEKNNVSPDEVFEGADTKVWWICKYGHSFLSSIGGRSRGNNCPICSGVIVSDENRLTILYPEVSKMWDYDKNGEVTPDEVAAKSSKVFFWKCSKGHSWDARVSDLTCKKVGCPYCSGKRVSDKNSLERLFPKIALQWDEKNELTPSEVSAFSRKKAWWICEKGHSWEAVIGNRTSNNTGCPFCNNLSTSFPEQVILYYCKKAFPSSVSRDTEAIGKELDIYIPERKTAIEYDGVRWHQGSKKEEADLIKEELCHQNGIVLYRVIEKGVNNKHLSSVNCIVLKKGNIEELEKAIKAIFIDLNVTNEIDINLSRDQIEIREKYNYLDVNDSIAIKNQDLVKEWDIQKNGLLKPEMFTPGSGQKVWWKCSNNHSWLASIGARTRQGTGCPYCNHQRASNEYNLQICHPNILEEWDFEKNNEVSPGELLPQSTKKVWWKCTKGHSYQMPVNAKTKSNVGCPYCSNDRIDEGNCFANLYPEIVKEWDYKKNTDINPNAIGAGCAKKVWWICPKGHSYIMMVCARTIQRQGCSFCAGKRIDNSNSLSSLYPELVREWDYDKNVGISPEKIAPKSGKKVYWICSKGHSFQSVISNRTGGSGCPYCGKRIARRIINVDTGEIYNNSSEAAQILNCSKSAINRGCSDTSRKVKGFHLKFIEY